MTRTGPEETGLKLEQVGLHKGSGGIFLTSLGPIAGQVFALCTVSSLLNTGSVSESQPWTGVSVSMPHRNRTLCDWSAQRKALYQFTSVRQRTRMHRR